MTTASMVARRVPARNVGHSSGRIVVGPCTSWARGTTTDAAITPRHTIHVSRRMGATPSRSWRAARTAGRLPPRGEAIPAYPGFWQRIAATYGHVPGALHVSQAARELSATCRLAAGDAVGAAVGRALQRGGVGHLRPRHPAHFCRAAVHRAGAR